MQQKKSDIIDVIDLSQLPDLTPKQEKFARGLLDGKSATDSYKAAYDCSNSADPSIWASASKLKTDPKIMLWVQAARVAGLERGVLTHTEFINRLLELAARSEAAGNYGAAVNAITTAGKAVGHLVEKIEDVTPLQNKDTREKLRDMATRADISAIINDEVTEKVMH